MSTPLHFVLNGIDMYPPPLAQMSIRRQKIETVSGVPLFAPVGSCNFTADPGTVVWDKFNVRFASSSKSGWASRAEAQAMWGWYVNNDTIVVSTNLTITELVDHNMMFNYSLSSPITLVRAVPDGTWWKYDISLRSV